jgi:hypothetical protein
MLAAAVLCVVVMMSRPAGATPQSAPFELALGHAAQPAFYFLVAAPGTVDVQVDTTMTEPVSVTLYAGATAIHTVRGQGRLAFAVTATREHLANGREWAVVVSGSTPASRGDGRIVVDTPDDVGRDPHRLDAWLREHPRVAFHLTWNDGAMSRPWSVWPTEMQVALRTAFDDAMGGRPSSIVDPPPNAWQRQPGDDPNAIHTAFAPEVARSFYVTAIAHALATEVERRVPWSLANLNGEELEALLPSTSLFWWNADQRAYEISEFDHGWAVPAAPHTAWAFLQREGLLKASRLDTIAALVGWARGLTHVAGPVSRANFQDHWGYDGDMPVSRALAGTRYGGEVFRSMPGYDQVRHFTAGCQGTAGLFLSVLRAANIPVRVRAVSNDSTPHATLIFLSEDRALSHGDDPYSLLAEGAPPAELLIDLDTYNRWLGPQSKDAGRYIGRQALALGLARLPPIVRRTYERDRQQGLAPAQGGVFTLFRSSYFMAELEEARLWERLDAARLMEAGGAAPASDGSADVWVEAESSGASVTAGTAEPQGMDDALLGTWRNQQQLRWRGARPGAELSIPFDVASDGTYRLSVRFTRAPNYAVLAIRLDDRTGVLDRVSLYAPQTVAADPLVLGEHVLTAGAHRLRFTITGAHALATPDYMVGIDAIRVERLR